MPLRIALALLVGAFACSPREPRVPLVQRASPSHTEAAPVERGARPRVAWLARLPSFVLVAEEPFRSQHFSDARLAEVRVSPAAAARYRTLVVGTQFEEGTVIVELLKPRAGAPPLLLALERRADGWHFGEYDAGGDPRPFDEAPCVGCHTGAVAAPVFGPSRASPPRESKR